jgi:hypothetical protein
MKNLTYHEYAKPEMHRREAGLRKAQLNGTAYEPKRRRQIAWPWRRNRVADAPGVPLRPGVQGR